MTTPIDPRDPVSDPAATYPTNPVTYAEVREVVPPAVDYIRPVQDSEAPTGHNKVKGAALLAAAVTVANKVRQEGPKKVQELQERRAAGRYIILREISGRKVAVGPYPNEQTAREDNPVAGFPDLVELLSPKAYSVAQVSTRGKPTAGAER